MDEITKQLTHDRHTYMHNGRRISLVAALKVNNGVLETFYPSGKPEFVEHVHSGITYEQTRFFENGEIDEEFTFKRRLVPAMCDKLA